MIVCLGTTPTVQRTMTFNNLRVDGVNRAASVLEYASGKSTNVARVLHSLGKQVVAMGFLGGERATPFREDLKRAGIPHEFLTVDAETRLCTTVIDKSTNTATELVEESRMLRARDYDALLERLAMRLMRAKALVMSGSLPPEAPIDFYASCLQMAGRNLPTVLDAAGEPLLKALKWHPLVVKPNVSEIEQTLDADVEDEPSLRGAMRELVALGAGWVVVTRGASSVLITNGKSFWEIHPPKIDVVSPIGSGDALAAGIVAGIVDAQDVPTACKLGIACGAANAMTPLAGHLQRSEVDALLTQIQ
jgi:1-phosphofructokinase family hexose kinase